MKPKKFQLKTLLPCSGINKKKTIIFGVETEIVINILVANSLKESCAVSYYKRQHGVQHLPH